MITELTSIEDFTLLLLFHMAHVDGSVHPNERDTILERMKAIFPEDKEMEKRLAIMESEYGSLGDARAEALLRDGMTKFVASPEMKKEIYAALFDIINANGRVNSEETHTLRIFREWLVGE